MTNASWTFYPALIATAVLAVALAERAGRFAASLGVVARAFRPLRARAACGGRRLSVLDRRADIAGSLANPTYSYRAARENPAAFRDVVVLLSQPMDPGRRHSGRDRTRPAERASVRGPARPAGCSTRPSTSIPLVSAGRKSPRPRATASASSRSASRRRSGRPCTEARSRRPSFSSLFATRASCTRPIEVINGGTEAYTLENNLELMRRRHPRAEARSHPLDPRHERTARASASAGGGAERAGRAAARLGPHRPRGADDRARPVRPADPQRRPPGPSAAAHRRQAHREPLRRGLSQAPVALARRNGAAVALATSSLAVDAGSPREVKDFYGAVFNRSTISSPPTPRTTAWSG